MVFFGFGRERGREISPSSAFVRWIAQRGEGAVKSGNWFTDVSRAPSGRRTKGGQLKIISLQVPGYSDKRLPRLGEFFAINALSPSS